MYILDNPVLQRELLVNLRTARSFVLLAVYLALLSAVVYLAWPTDERLDMTNSNASRQLVNMSLLRHCSLLLKLHGLLEGSEQKTLALRQIIRNVVFAIHHS